MFAFEIDFFPHKNTRGDELGQFDWHLEMFLSASLRDNNVIGDWQVIDLADRVQARFMAPETSSLQSENLNIYARQALEEIEKLSWQPRQTRCVGKLANFGQCCSCENCSRLILFTSYLDIGLPVDCADCGHPVPLYKLPYLQNQDEHFALSCWRKNYQALDSVFMSSFVGERPSYVQLSNPRSAFMRYTRQLAAELEEKIGKPVCVFLMHVYSTWGDNCPLCKRPWRVEEAEEYEFQCDHCRLVSSKATADEGASIEELNP